MGVYSWIFGSDDDEYVEENDALTTWEWALSFFSSSVLDKKILEKEKRDKELFHKLQALIRSSDDSIKNEEEDSTPEANTNMGCVIRSGQVTFIRESSGCIDGNIHFDIRDAPQGIKLDDKVMYIAFRANPEDDWSVRKVTAILNEKAVAWDAEDETLKFEPQLDQPPKDFVLETMYRSELGKV